MAVQRTAVIQDDAPAAGPGRILELSLDDGELGFRGGQYLIVDTGIPKGDGKTVKRPYSIVSADREQRRFSLAVRRISGAGSQFMMDVSVGQALRFSGPWGKWTAPELLAPGPIWVWATDTGITAAVGLLRGQAFSSRLQDVTLVWNAESRDYFLPGGWLAEVLPPGVELRFAQLPPVGHVERPGHARALARRLAGEVAPASAFLVGDGDVLRPVAEDLVAGGLAASQVHLEYFFHRPQKGAA